MRTRNLRHLVILFILRSIYAEEDLCPVGTGMIAPTFIVGMRSNTSLICSEECETEGTCIAWEFDIDLSDCYLYQTAVHIITQYAFTGFKDCGNDYKCPIQEIITIGYIGHRYHRTQWQDCLEDCQKDVDCGSWIHASEDNTCYLYSGSSFLTPCGNNSDPRCDLSKEKYEGTESINLGQKTLNLCSQECINGYLHGGFEVTGMYHANNGTCFCLTDKNPVFDAGYYGDHVCLLNTHQ